MFDFFQACLLLIAIRDHRCLQESQTIYIACEIPHIECFLNKQFYDSLKKYWWFNDEMF